MREDEAASLLPRDHVDVAIVGFFRLRARADFKVERGLIALVDQMMPIGLAGGKPAAMPAVRIFCPALVTSVTSPCST